MQAAILWTCVFSWPDTDALVLAANDAGFEGRMDVARQWTTDDEGALPTAVPKAIGWVPAIRPNSVRAKARTPSGPCIAGAETTAR